MEIWSNFNTNEIILGWKGGGGGARNYQGSKFPECPLGHEKKNPAGSVGQDTFFKVFFSSGRNDPTKKT